MGDRAHTLDAFIFCNSMKMESRCDRSAKGEQRQPYFMGGQGAMHADLAPYLGLGKDSWFRDVWQRCAAGL